MTVKVEMFESWHLDELDVKDIFKSELKAENPEHFTYTFFKEKKVIAIFGLTLKWQGMGELWALTSNLVKDIPVAFHKACLSLLDAHIKKLNLHRVQCSIRADYLIGMKWVEALGFIQEGYMQKYGPNKMDYYLYARII